MMDNFTDSRSANQVFKIQRLYAISRSKVSVNKIFILFIWFQGTPYKKNGKT